MRIDWRSLGSAVAAAAALAGGGLGGARPAAAAVSPWASNPQSQVRLITAWRVAPRRGELRLGVQFRLAPGWHVYWKNSGDAGFAPAVTFARQPGLAPPALLWPAPHRFELPGGLQAFGYSGEVVYPVSAALDAPAGRDRLRLAANVDYLVCEVDCIPYRYDLTLDQPLGKQAEPDAQTAPLLDSWWRQLPLAAGTQPVAPGAAAVTARLELGAATAGPALPPTTPAAPSAAARPAPAGASAPAELRLELRLRGVSAAPGGADLFFEVHPALEPGRPRAVAASDGLAFEVPLRRKDLSAPLPATTEIAWTATGLRQAGSPGSMALAGRQTLAVPRPARQAGSAPGGQAAGGERRPAGRGSATRAEPGAAVGPGRARALRSDLAGADPRWLALAAAAAALLTLERWGLLRRRPAAGGGPAARPAPGADRLRREAAGFLALLLTVGLLYALSLEISPEGLAGVELVLLAMGLLAWLRRRIERPGLPRTLLAAAVVACAAAPPWLAARHRLPGELPAGRPASPAGTASLQGEPPAGPGAASGAGAWSIYDPSTQPPNRRSFDA